MALKHEAAAMLATGIGLVAQELTAWGNGETMTNLRPTLVRKTDRSGEICYEVVDYRHNLTGQVQRFTEPLEATTLFQKLVGRAAMSRAVASHRYGYLFPKGSSLEWEPPRSRPASQARSEAA